MCSISVSRKISKIDPLFMSFTTKPFRFGRFFMFAYIEKFSDACGKVLMISGH